MSPLPQRTEAQRDALQAALDERAPGQYVVVLGLKHADPEDRGRRRRRSPRRASSGSSASCWLRTTRRSRSASTSPGPGAAAADGTGVAVRRRRELGDRAGARRLPRRRPVRRRLAAMPAATRGACFTAHSLPAAHPRRAATRTPTSCGRRPRPSPSASAWPRRHWSIAWQIGRPHPRAVDRARHPAGDRRARRRRRRRRRARLRLRLRGRPPRGALRPRHRGRAGGPTQPASRSPARPA